MKKILNVCVFLVVCMFSFDKKVSAIEFRNQIIKGEYILVEPTSGPIQQSVFHYFTDENGNYIYSIHPSSTYSTGDDYLMYDESDYNELSDEDKYRIGLIIEYGYGYGDHTDMKWYEVSQMMIMRTIFPDYRIIFQTGFNGSPINDKYEVEFAEMEELINDHIDDINLNYNDKLVIPKLTNMYSITSSSYQYNMNNRYEADNIKSDGTITYMRKPLHRFNSNIIYYAGDKGGYVIPGNTNLLSNKVNINLNKSNLNVYLEDKSDIYSIEKSLNNTCYEFSLDEDYVKNVCFNDNEKVELKDIYRGIYNIKQVSNGVGYMMNSESFEIPVMVDNMNIRFNAKPVVNTFYVQHNYCVDDVCQPLVGINYSLYDSNNDLVTTLTSDNNGKIQYELGYGTYLLEQDTGIQGFSMSAPIQFKIDNSEDVYSFKLKNKLFEPVTVKPGISNNDTNDSSLTDNELNDKDSSNNDFVSNGLINKEDNSNELTNSSLNDINNKNDKDMVNNSSVVIIDKDNNEVLNSNDEDVVIDTILDDELISIDNDIDSVSDFYYDEIIDNPNTGCFINWVFGLGCLLLFNIVLLLAIKAF